MGLKLYGRNHNPKKVLLAFEEQIREPYKRVGGTIESESLPQAHRGSTGSISFKTKEWINEKGGFHRITTKFQGINVGTQEHEIIEDYINKRFERFIANIVVMQRRKTALRAAREKLRRGRVIKAAKKGWHAVFTKTPKPIVK
ncbi:MAG: hypothetical protein ABIA76_06230 [Candidatus Diapherotrites archaeon]